MSRGASIVGRPSKRLPLRPLVPSFFARPTLVVARDLIGCLLVHDSEEGRTVGRIVEAEAYTASDDPGSHANRGQTPRNSPMFEEPGRAYVYFTYGNHFMLNAVAHGPGVAGAALIRAVEPLEGIDLMRARRGPVRDRDLALGPGRLTQAFGLHRDHNRLELTRPPLYICTGERYPEGAVSAGPRIGLGSTQDGRAWRFHLAGSSWVSTGPTGYVAPAARRRKRR